MGNKLIKESTLTSKSLALCSRQANFAWVFILFCGDDWGCFNADPQAVKSRAFPMRDDISTDTIASWLQEYEDNDMLFRWKVGDREYGYFINNSKHNSEYRSKWHRRKTPLPPEALLVQYLQEHSILYESVQDGSVLFQDVPTTSNSRPIPIPTPTPTPTPKKKKDTPEAKTASGSSPRKPYHLWTNEEIAEADPITQCQVLWNRCYFRLTKHEPVRDYAKDGRLFKLMLKGGWNVLEQMKNFFRQVTEKDEELGGYTVGVFKAWVARIDAGAVRERREERERRRHE